MERTTAAARFLLRYTADCDGGGRRVTADRKESGQDAAESRIVSAKKHKAWASNYSHCDSQPVVCYVRVNSFVSSCYERHRSALPTQLISFPQDALPTKYPIAALPTIDDGRPTHPLPASPHSSCMRHHPQSTELALVRIFPAINIYDYFNRSIRTGLVWSDRHCMYVTVCRSRTSGSKRCRRLGDLLYPILMWRVNNFLSLQELLHEALSAWWYFIKASKWSRPANRYQLR